MAKANPAIDPVSIIRMCLSCTKPKCTNCIRRFPTEKLDRLRKGGDHK